MSKEELIKEMAEIILDETVSNISKEDAENIFKEIYNAGYRKEKQGEWVDTSNYVSTSYGSLKIYKCSFCNADITIDDCDNYCPNCGARMEEK